MDAFTQELFDYLEGILTLMLGYKPEILLVKESGLLVFDVRDDAFARMLGTTNVGWALVHLLRKKIKDERGLPYRIDVDSYGARRARRLELIDIANKTADAVLSNKKAIFLQGFSSEERRELILAANARSGIQAVAQGSGVQRKVMVARIRDEKKRERSDCLARRY